jgi:hypothetical protein
MSKRDRLVRISIITVFVSLYALTSTVSTIHVIDFFELSNPRWLAITLAIAFEIGAAASLSSLVILEKMNKTLVWTLFIAITLMQIQGNMFFAYKNLHNFQQWSELFNLIEEEPIFQKRILAMVSGAILPLVALGFIKSLIDYIKPEGKKDEVDDRVDVENKEEIVDVRPIQEETKEPVLENVKPTIETEPANSHQNNIIQEISKPTEDTYKDEFRLPFGENMKSVLSHDYNPPVMVNANSNKEMPKTHDSKNNPK